MTISGNTKVIFIAQFREISYTTYRQDPVHNIPDMKTVYVWIGLIFCEWQNSDKNLADRFFKT
jgi:hypothetical protein